MSNPAFSIVPSLYQALACSASFTNGSPIRPVVDGSLLPPVGPTSTSPLLFGGCSVIDLHATSTDATARDLLFYEGRVVTTQGGSTGALSTTASSVVRQSGSWITEGWKPGQGVILVTPEALAEDAQAGIFAVVTGVSSTTLTLSGTPLTVNAGLAAGTKVVRARPIGRVSLKSQQGGTTTDPTPVDVISTLALGRTMKLDWKIGYGDMLLAGPAAGVTAGSQLSIGGAIALY